MIKCDGIERRVKHECVFMICREVEYLKKETAQQRAQEESEATHKEETDNLQEKVGDLLVFPFPLWM